MMQRGSVSFLVDFVAANSSFLPDQYGKEINIVSVIVHFIPPQGRFSIGRRKHGIHWKKTNNELCFGCCDAV